MKTIVATAKTREEAEQVLTAIYNREPFIVWADISGLQVTAIYETRAEIDKRQEREYQQVCNENQAIIDEIEAAAKAEVKPAKKYKQPRPIELQNKADSIGLSHLDIDRNDGIYTVTKKKCYGGELLFASKSGISVSRQLTKMSWEHAWKEYLTN